MSRELLLLVDALAREKNVEKTTVFGALELALASATKKRFHEEVDVRVAIDPMTGNYQSFRRWQVVPDEAVENRAHQIPLSEAMKVKADIKLEEYIEEPLEPVEFGRIGAQTAKSLADCVTLIDAMAREELELRIARGDESTFSDVALKKARATVDQRLHRAREWIRAQLGVDPPRAISRAAAR